jgi:hypothetical protein
MKLEMTFANEIENGSFEENQMGAAVKSSLTEINYIAKISFLNEP